MYVKSKHIVLALGWVYRLALDPISYLKTTQMEKPAVLIFDFKASADRTQAGKSGTNELTALQIINEFLQSPTFFDLLPYTIPSHSRSRKDTV